eukprot:scaffold75227_cov55-Prasinocladus_malaysianus.AAC.1
MQSVMQSERSDIPTSHRIEDDEGGEHHQQCHRGHQAVGRHVYRLRGPVTVATKGRRALIDVLQFHRVGIAAVANLTGWPDVLMIRA